jgi:uncharacterized protein
MPTYQEVVKQLNLSPHPEKGYYLETFRDSVTNNERADSTAIYYLLEKDVISEWHRVLDAVEIWHYYAGAPLELSLSTDDGTPVRKAVLGADIFNGQVPQVIVRRKEWQRAVSLGDWTLVGCTVAPGFQFESFEMAPEGWSPRSD